MFEQKGAELIYSIERALIEIVGKIECLEKVIIEFGRDGEKAAANCLFCKLYNDFLLSASISFKIRKENEKSGRNK